MTLTLHPNPPRRHSQGTPPSVAAFVQLLSTLPEGELFTTARLRLTYPSLSTALFSRHSTHPALKPYRFVLKQGMCCYWGSVTAVKLARSSYGQNSKQ